MSAAIRPAAAPATPSVFAQSIKRVSRYSRDKSARVIACPEVSDSATVTRATRPGTGSAPSVPVALLIDGSTETAFPLCALGSLLSGAGISAAELAELLPAGILAELVKLATPAAPAAK